MHYIFSENMAAMIERSVGISLGDLREKELDEIHRSIEKKVGHKLKLGFSPGHIGRVNVLIQQDRIIWREEIERLWQRV